MKRQIKKWTALLLSVAMVFAMVGCGNPGDDKKEEQGGQKEENQTKLEDTSAADVDETLATAPHFNITVMLGSFTDGQGVETKAMLEYIEKHFNVTFNYVETSNTTENTIAAIETAVASDTDGIIGACVKTAACVEAAGTGGKGKLSGQRLRGRLCAGLCGRSGTLRGRMPQGVYCQDDGGHQRVH